MKDFLKIERIEDVCHSYQGFVIDIWGVIFNGIDVNPNQKAVETLKTLHALKKKIVLVSNSVRLKRQIEDFIGPLHVLVDNIVTSADCCVKVVENFKKKKMFKCFSFGSSGILHNNGLFFTNNMGEADFVVLKNVMNSNIFFEHDLRSYKKPLVCIKSDVFYRKDNLNLIKMSDMIQEYRQIQPQVFLCSKPYPHIYEMAKENFEPEDKILAIGDSVFNDVLGAQRMGIDSLLITQGIHKTIFSENLQVEKLFEIYDVTPKYTMDELQF